MKLFYTKLLKNVFVFWFQRSSDPQFEILYKKAIKHAAFNKTVLDLVSHHQHAYIDWQIVLATAIRDSLRITGKCEYIVGKELNNVQKLKFIAKNIN